MADWWIFSKCQYKIRHQFGHRDMLMSSPTVNQASCDVVQMKLQDGNHCLPSVVPTLSNWEVKHENEVVQLSMKYW